MNPRKILAPAFLTKLSPNQFHDYVIGLQAKLSPPKKEVRPASDINIRLNHKKHLVVRIRNRNPKYITPEEFEQTKADLKLPTNVFDLALRERKILVRTHDEIKTIIKEQRSIPW